MTDHNQVQSAAPLTNAISRGERSWALGAHLSLFLILLTYFLAAGFDIWKSSVLISGTLVGPLVCIIAYLRHKKRSEYVAFHALQALLFQIVFIAIMGLAVVILPPGSNEAGFLCLVPIVCGLPLLAMIGAFSTLQGKDFKYPLIGQWIKKVFKSNPAT